MSSLRVVTFNVQLMTRMLSKGKFDLGEFFADPYQYRLDRLRQALDSEPAPDVLVLNEVFSEEARLRLVAMLGPLFPHIEPSFGPTDALDLITAHSKIDDCGLMVCSRWPVQVLAFDAFGASAGWDAVANKGFALLRVQAPEPVVLVVTHLQADEVHADIRGEQLRQICHAVDVPAVLGEFPVILCGDLNIAGNPPRPEWAAVFEDPAGGPVTRLFTDCWDRYMPAADRGPTSNGQRLDYVLAGASPVRHLVAQHMRIRHRGVSDHCAVWADINLESSACTPAGARVIQPARGQWCGGEALDFAHPGSMQWCRIDRPGTYVFTAPPQHDLRIFEAANISEPLPDFDGRVVDLQDIPGSQAAWQALDLPPAGRKFQVPNAPFFVQLTNPAGAAGPTRFGWVLCQGRSAEDAIALQSHHVPELFVWPAGVAGFEAWFEAFLCPCLDATPHTSTFYVDNPTRGSVKLRLRDSHQVVLAESRWTDAAHVDLEFQDPGDRAVYFTVEPGPDGPNQVQVGWRTELTMLTGARGATGQEPYTLGLYCEDETGSDWAGGDETVLTLFHDGREIARFPADRPQWDADSGDLEAFPIQAIAFRGGLGVEVRELDDLGDDVGDTRIDPLQPLDPGDDPNSPSALRWILVRVGSGAYQLRFNLVRSPVGGSPHGSP